MILILLSVSVCFLYLIYSYKHNFFVEYKSKFVKLFILNIVLITSIYFLPQINIPYFDFIFGFALICAFSVSKFKSKKLIVVCIDILVNSVVLFLLIKLLSSTSINLIFLVVLISIVLFDIIEIWNRYTKNKKKMEKIIIPLKDFANQDLRIKYILDTFEPLDCNIYIINSSTINSHVYKAKNQFNIIITTSLLQNFETVEIISIIYHELGHCKMKHTYITFFSKLTKDLSLIVICYILVCICKKFDYSLISCFILMIILSYPYLNLTEEVEKKILWQQEYSADAYSIKKFAKVSLVQALKKLQFYQPQTNIKTHPSYTNRIDKINSSL